MAGADAELDELDGLEAPPFQRVRAQPECCPKCGRRGLVLADQVDEGGSRRRQFACLVCAIHFEGWGD